MMLIAVKPKDHFKPNRNRLLKFHSDTKLFTLPSTNVKDYPKVWKNTYYKEYPRFSRILLPLDNNLPKMDLFDAIANRKSERNFSSESIEIGEFSKIVYFSAGIINIEANTIARRAYPSAGARYPLEVYPIILRGGKNFQEGIYHYNVKQHSLELLFQGNFKPRANYICGPINKKIIDQAAIILMITAVFGRTQIKYGDRAYRFVLFEAGHLLQNIYLISFAFNVGACAIGGFLDDEANKLLDLEQEKEQTIYIVALGKKRYT